MSTATNTIGPRCLITPRPSKRAGILAICWVIWFTLHITWFAPHVQQDDFASIHHYHHHQKKKNKLIDGSIIHELPVHGLHADGTDVEYRCYVGEVISKPKRYRLWGGLNGTRQPLQHPLNRSGVLDFATHISRMKLRVLIVGNSLGEQLHAGLEEAMCYPINMTTTKTSEDREDMSKQSKCKTVYASNANAQWIKDPRIVTHTSSSGGLLGVIKDNTNMIDTKTKWMWNNTAISSLVNVLKEEAAAATTSDDGTADNKNNTINLLSDKGDEKRGLLDVFIYQFQSGHVELKDFDEYYLKEAIIAASQFFQASTVIFPTIAWMNNVDKPVGDKWREVNERIRTFAKEYSPGTTTSSSVTSVQILDIAELSRIYIEENAKILNIPSNETYKLRVQSRWKSLVAQMCASLPFPDHLQGCLPGMVSVRERDKE